MLKKLLFLCVIFTQMWAVQAQNIDTENTDPTYDDFSIFRNHDTDKYYMGWLDSRAMISQAFFNYNFDVTDAFLYRQPDFDFDFSDVWLYVNLRLATELIFYRNEYVSVGGAGAMEALMFSKKERIDDASFYVYGFWGEFAAYTDIWLKPLVGIDMKIRIYPFYHQSTNFVDGYKGDFAPMGASYEFFAITAYYYKNIGKHSFSPYAGIEATYRWAGNGAQAFKAQAGNDYRYSISEKYDINLLVDLNVAYIRDHKDNLNLIDNQNSVAVAAGVGVEFHNFVLGAKYTYGRGRDATAYFADQSALGIELSVFL